MKNLKVLIVLFITTSNFLHVFSQTTLKFEALKVDISSSANIELKAYDACIH